MGYFDEKKNVEEYLQMADGYDGRDLIDVLKKHLTAGSSVLELGMGPGKDLDMLLETFEATGLDLSDVFLDMYREKKPNADLIKLDAVTIDTDRTFDCIYSNKVLHHLTKADLAASFVRQKDILKDNGILLHSFWLGDKEETMKGLRFVYYQEEELLSLIGDGFEALEITRYSEMEQNDSFFVLLRRVTLD